MKNHPNNLKTETKSICRDFVRGRCIRPFCRFPHVTSPESVVFCHDFQNASCQRVNCRFLHYSLHEEEYYRTYNILPSTEPKSINLYCKDMATYGQCCHSDACRSAPQQKLLTDLKRSSSEQQYDIQSPKRYRDDDFDILTVIRRLDEEQKNLRSRIESNEIKISNLLATNEYLMQQNAQIRLTSVQCSRSITNTTAAPHTTVLGTVSIAPVQVQSAPSIVSMAGPIQPLAITANTSQGQLALSQQTLTTSQCPLGTGHSSQILSTSQITLAPALAPAPSIGLTINTSQALAMSNSTQPIISYPVMTHSILPH